ncbi:hypothetical protein EG68_07270 [Paragonimus skrjabini miyazakii]|uniref:AAA+ ATPase domain-containing protein n=1 Tax=Paragonimus skrjabini miyazakii TaxID=59628 RepID=A0A8S9YYJ1_9TREM|nr:hypothetical protein EG68_07270 [Paragonimus skrjabini miyazakii]
MPSDDYSVAKHLLSSAITAEDRREFGEARRCYTDAVTRFRKVLQTSSDTTVLTRSREFCQNAVERIKYIDEKHKQNSVMMKPSSSVTKHRRNDRVLPDKETLKKELKNVNDAAVDRILKEVLEDCSSLTLDDVAGNERAKQILNEAVILPTLRPELFTGLRSPTRGVLLFGPPGNGKTMLAKAIACESNCVFFNISAASLLSKWVGESENLVRTLFIIARHTQPSIIFLDEVDSLLTARRSDNSHEVSRRVLTQLLSEMDGVGSGNERVLILAATNRPGELDDAALRRFPRRIYIRMPDTNARLALLRALLDKNTNHTLSENDMQKIASRTEGYSASDLKELAKEAALQPIRDIDSTKLRTVSPQAIRPINLSDFIHSLNNVRPSLASSSLVAYEKWNSQFGESTNENRSTSTNATRSSVGKLFSNPLSLM